MQVKSGSVSQAPSLRYPPGSVIKNKTPPPSLIIPRRAGQGCGGRERPWFLGKDDDSLQRRFISLVEHESEKESRVRLEGDCRRPCRRRPGARQHQQQQQRRWRQQSQLAGLPFTEFGTCAICRSSCFGTGGRPAWRARTPPSRPRWSWPSTRGTCRRQSSCAPPRPARGGLQSPPVSANVLTREGRERERQRELVGQIPQVRPERAGQANPRLSRWRGRGEREPTNAPLQGRRASGSSCGAPRWSSGRSADPSCSRRG